MGACEFDATQHGLTVDDAFRLAHEHAAWEHGHGGYTGTIAEKGGYVFFDIKARGLSAKRFLDLYRRYMIWKLDQPLGTGSARVEGWKTGKSKPADVTDYEMTKVVKNGKTVSRSYRWFSTKPVKIPPCPVDQGLRDFFERVHQAADDKWGDAVAIELDGDLALNYKKRYGLAGKRGVRVFHFFGYASC